MRSNSRARAEPTPIGAFPAAPFAARARCRWCWSRRRCERIEGRAHRPAQRPAQQRRLDREAGDEAGEHRRHARHDHPRAFGEPRQREAPPAPEHELRHVVGGEDRARGGLEPARRQRSGGARDSLADPLHRQRLADHAGRRDLDLARARADLAREQRGHLARIAQPRAPLATFEMPLFTTIRARSRRAGARARRRRERRESGCS
jgi:hypothetical protein